MAFLRSSLVFGFFLIVFGCAQSGSKDTVDDTTDETGATDEDKTDDPPPTGGKKDATVASNGGKDSGASSSVQDAGKTEVKDSGATTRDPKDAGTTQTADAGKGVDAGAKDAGGGFQLPDLFPPNDAGSTAKPDAGGSAGAPGDKSGPCKDLQLLCFDPFDMFIFNPSDCLTCNGGKGCQGCAFPFAY
ncbi:MAG TPA: hypothetical protein VFX59_26685 [Polyangiales bacterium]|nr:hypothetical protein [Polyangiales bacterium]